MAVRTTMAALITRVRRFINDGTGAQFTDQEIQDTLDGGHRRDVPTTPLRPVATFTPALTWHDYYADTEAWEDGMTVQDGHYAVVTPDVTEPLVGHFAFTADRPPPLFVTGKVYDLHGAAADLLEQWAAALDDQFDFTSSQQQQFKRSQLSDKKRAAAQQQWALAWPRTATATRGDMAAAGAGGDRLDDRGLPYGTGYGRQP